MFYYEFEGKDLFLYFEECFYLFFIRRFVFNIYKYEWKIIINIIEIICIDNFIFINYICFKLNNFFKLENILF